jgi:beta-N-acetylhexosaminidase
VPSATILGCAGPVLGPEERAFFSSVEPLGFILFARNIETPEQVRRLAADLRESVGRGDAPILIDQEGGRVQRLRPPHWRAAPSARSLGELFARDAQDGLRALWLNSRLFAAELLSLGIDVDCLPCLDVVAPGEQGVIGDRAYGEDPGRVVACGRAAASGLLDGGVLPVMKHIPGHGRGDVDSHHALPRVDVDLETLASTDFAPFRSLSDLPLAMTAHIVYPAIDSDAPATQSPAVIRAIREDIGFDGLLMTDDLSMKALGGGFRARAERSIAAGCDVVLHCNGDRAEMEGAVSGAGPLTDAAARRWATASSMRRVGAEFDADAGRAELEALLA